MKSIHHKLMFYIVNATYSVYIPWSWVIKVSWQTFKIFRSNQIEHRNLNHTRKVNKGEGDSSIQASRKCSSGFKMFLFPLRGQRGLPFHVLLKSRPVVTAISQNQKPFLRCPDSTPLLTMMPAASLTSTRNGLLYSLSSNSIVLIIPKRFFGRGKRYVL